MDNGETDISGKDREVSGDIMPRKRKRRIKINLSNVTGGIGFFILVLVAIYLFLKITGIVQSASTEALLLATVIGQVFYNGYSMATFKSIDKRLDKLEK